jgi:hypothetical protein
MKRMYQRIREWHIPRQTSVARFGQASRAINFHAGYSAKHYATVPRRGCGTFAGIGHARLCFVVPIATGAAWQVIEFTACLIDPPLS